jgi:formate dehydrogenase iron-sulfur subunit
MAWAAPSRRLWFESQNQPVCLVDRIYQTEQGVVLHSKDSGVGCGCCLYACPFGAPQYPQAGNFG